MKQIKALGTSQAGLPFELDVSVIPEVVGLTLWQRQQKERLPLRFWSPVLERDRNKTYLHTAIAHSSVHSTPTGKASHEGTA